MIQTVYCECGESIIKYSRCVGCNRIRPNSSELLTEVIKLRLDLKSMIKELESVLELEKNEK